MSTAHHLAEVPPLDAIHLLTHLSQLNVPVWTATTGTSGREVNRPHNWQAMTADGNRERMAAWQPGMAFSGNMGGQLVVLDGDTRNGCNIQAVEAMLNGIAATVYAAVDTPSGGRHWYLPGHPDLPTIHATSDRDGFTGYPGLELISYGANVFLPGTQRPKYGGKGYTILYDRLQQLAEQGGDPETAENLAAWVAAHRRVQPEPFTPTQPWDGTPPDTRQQRYLDATLANTARRAAEAPAGERNTRLFHAAMCAGNYVTGAGLDEAAAIAALQAAAATSGLTRDDGPGSVNATIQSGLRVGKSMPRSVPDPTHQQVTGLDLNASQKATQPSWTPQNASQPLSKQSPSTLRPHPSDSDTSTAPTAAAMSSAMTRSATGTNANSADTRADTDSQLEAEIEAHARFRREVDEQIYRLRVVEAAQHEHRLQTQPPAPPFDAAWLHELAARPPEPPGRAEGIIPWGSSTLLVAKRKTGKTTLLLNIARSYLTGEPLLDRYPVRPTQGAVAMLNYEVSAGMVGRWSADIDIPEDRFFVVNLRGRRNPLTHPDDRQHLADILQTIGTETLIVDPFGRAYNGKSQNDNGEVNNWLVGLDEFARTECGATDLILAAHAGWEGERSRGASALEDWPDSIITLTSDQTDDNDGARYLKALGRDVEVEESEIFMDPATRLLRFNGGGSRAEKKRKGDTSKLAMLVARAARSHPGCSKQKVMDVICEMDDFDGFGRNRDKAVARAIAMAAEAGSIRVEDSGQGRPMKLWPVHS